MHTFATIPILTWLVMIPYLLVVLVVIPVLVWRAMRRHADPTPRATDVLDPVEIGVMHSNARAMLVAVVELLRQGAITLDGEDLRAVPGRTGAAVGHISLVQQVAAAVSRRSETSPRGLAREVASYLHVLRESLARRGYLQSAWPGVGRVILVLLGLLMIGPAAIVATAPGVVPTAIIVPVVASPMLMVLVLSVIHGVTEARLRRRSRPTPAGRRAVEAFLYHHRHLQPVHRPSWRTYGTGAAAPAAALFGAVAVADLHPDLVEFESQLPEPVASVATGAGGTGSTPTSTSDWNWSGGSCSSGCGGGSGGGCGSN